MYSENKQLVDAVNNQVCFKISFYCFLFFFFFFLVESLFKLNLGISQRGIHRQPFSFLFFIIILINFPFFFFKGIFLFGIQLCAIRVERRAQRRGIHRQICRDQPKKSRGSLQNRDGMPDTSQHPLRGGRRRLFRAHQLEEISAR